VLKYERCLRIVFKTFPFFLFSSSSVSNNSVGPPSRQQFYAPQRGNSFPVRAQQANNNRLPQNQRGRPQQQHRGQQQPQRGQTQNKPNRFSQPIVVEADYASADYAYPADYQEYDYADYFAVSGPSSRPVAAQSTGPVGTNSGGGSYYYPQRYPSYYYPGYPPYYPGYYNYPATAGQASTSTSTACGNSGCAAAAAAASGGAVSSSSSTSGGAGMSTL
jgi:hypothetical protein